MMSVGNRNTNTYTHLNCIDEAKKAWMFEHFAPLDSILCSLNTIRVCVLWIEMEYSHRSLAILSRQVQIIKTHRWWVSRWREAIDGNYAPLDVLSVISIFHLCCFPRAHRPRQKAMSAVLPVRKVPTTSQGSVLVSLRVEKGVCLSVCLSDCGYGSLGHTLVQYFNNVIIFD